MIHRRIERLATRMTKETTRSRLAVVTRAFIGRATLSGLASLVPLAAVDA